MSKRPTIVDVARHAGVSKSTVSLVLQDSPLVRKSTRGEVEKAMNALNYVYNRSAANLRGADVGLIGLRHQRSPQPVLHRVRRQRADDLRQPRLRHRDRQHRREPRHPGASDHLDDRAWRCWAFSISPTYVDEPDPLEGVPPRRNPGDAGAAPDRCTHRNSSRSPRSTTPPAAASRRSTCCGSARAGSPSRRPREPSGDARAHVRLRRGDGGGRTRDHRLPRRPSRGFGRDLALRLHAERPDIEAAICFSDLVALGVLAGLARPACGSASTSGSSASTTSRNAPSPGRS